MNKTYIVVENAGYEREHDVRTFPSFRAAAAFIRSQYEPDEVDSLHVEIAVERDGERSYEL